MLCHSPKGNFYTYATSGQVTTSGKFAQTYGRFSIRARMPASTVGGIHSALWLWPQSPITTQLLGEIDLAEVYSALNDRAVPVPALPARQDDRRPHVRHERLHQQLLHDQRRHRVPRLHARMDADDA